MLPIIVMFEYLDKQIADYRDMVDNAPEKVLEQLAELRSELPYIAS